MRLSLLDTGADPGFLEGGFKSTLGVCFQNFTGLKFHKFPHEIEIVLSNRGVQANPSSSL